MSNSEESDYLKVFYAGIMTGKVIIDLSEEDREEILKKGWETVKKYLLEKKA